MIYYIIQYDIIASKSCFCSSSSSAVATIFISASGATPREKGGSPGRSAA